MFIGHFGVGLAAKKIVPKINQVNPSGLLSRCLSK